MPASSVEIDGVAFAYDGRVLTPRPWTLAQAAWGRDLLHRLPAGPVLELCSGVGHIGLLTVRDVERGLVMVDASLAACDLARANAETMGLGGRVVSPGCDTPCGRLATAADPTGAVFKLVAG